MLERFTEEVTAALNDRDADEVLLSSVSLGAVMMAEAIDRFCGREPDIDMGSGAPRSSRSARRS